MESIASLFFSLLALSNLFSPNLAFATSFGPITLTEQARNAQYFVRAKVLTPGKAAMAPKLNVPFTYWTISLLDQPLGPPLPAQLDIRETGGEIGQMGYHRAGSATFREGEEIFVALKDTDEGEVKEVVGLSSGKYTVSENGKALQSGLGPTIMGADNSPLSPEEFTQILRRVASGRETARDKTIFVNRGPKPGSGIDQDHAHEDDPALAAAEAGIRDQDTDRVTEASKSTTAPRAKVASQSAIPFKPTSLESEKLPTGTSMSFWWILALFAGALVATLVILRR